MTLSLRLLVILVIALAVSDSRATTYQITALETPPDIDSYAAGINSRGEVAGRVDYRAVLWRDDKMIDIGTFGGEASSASDINNKGQVVGIAYSAPTCHNLMHSFIWKNGDVKGIERFKGRRVTASAINDSGQIVGHSDDEQGFLWDEAKGMRDLGYLRYYKSMAHDINSMAHDINNKGKVVGESGNCAFIWQDGKMTELDKLEGMEGARAGAINDKGQVVGSSYNLGYFNKKRTTRACLWEKGKVTDLGTLGGEWSEASDINNKGQIVGMSGVSGSEVGSTATHAFLWVNGKMVDLNTLIPSKSGWVLRTASAINDAGMIVGNGDFKGRTRAFLLAPQP